MQAMSKFPRNMHLGRTLMRFLVQISTVYYCLKVKTFSRWEGMNAILASIAQVDSGDILEKKKSIVVMRKAQEEDKRTTGF
uniref:Uncharacterized protein n=1 Tax=Oryza glumipatula TaxID=40148 RepID=A0A0E0APQ9_9ORYZ